MAAVHPTLFGMKTANRFQFFILISVFLTGTVRAQTNNFDSIEYYPAPSEMQMKSRLIGADAEPLEGGLLDIKQFQLEMFATNGAPQVIVNAPECIYDMPDRLANSPGEIFLQNGDGKIHAEGDGFLWRQTESSLTISNNVKTLIASVALAATASWSAAQTNPVATTNTVRGPTRISSRTGDFDLNARQAIYSGDVHVTDPQMKLTCEWLVADLPQSGQINHIVALTNVVIDFTQNERTTHATGEKAVYHFSVENGATNETVTLTGSPQVESAQNSTIFTNTADVIIWNRINNSFRFINPHTTIENLNGPTNSPANTNQLVAPKTNLPPGTIENIDRMIIPNQP